MTAPRTATCPTCSTVVADSDRFCKSCGTVVSGISASIPIGGGGYPPAESPTTPSGPLSASSPWELVLARLRSVTGGEFEIGRELGRGGMAAVFLAQDLALNRRVAIKVMAPGLMLGEGMVQRFRQEAITIANLSHAHIVTIHAVRQLQDLHFFVMQFVEGQALEAVLRSHGPLPIDVVRVILHHVGSALAYAHRRGVVHRDIKPGNILLSGDGDALVTDFGIAKVAEGPTQTQTGMVVGTPTYMSPEQCYAQELDGSSDQYSLGIVAYQMLTGHVPFSGAAFEIMKGHTTDPVPPMRAVRPDIPESVEAAVLRMLAKKPADRFATFGDALAALGAHAIGEDSPLRAELVRLAAVEERREQLGDLLRTPASPVSGSRRRTSGATPAAVPAATPAPVTPAPAAPAPETPAPETPAPAAMAPVVATLSVSALPGTVRVGDTFRVHASPLDALGQPVARAVSWSAVGTAVEVTADGTVRALTPGRAALNAACDEVYETVVLSVLPTAAASGAGEALPAASSGVRVNTSAPMNATAVLAGGLEAATPVSAAPATTPPPVAPPAVAPSALASAPIGAAASTASVPPSVPARSSRPPWIYAAAAVPVLLIAFLLLRPKAEENSAVPQPAPSETTASTTTESVAEPIDAGPAPIDSPTVEPTPPTQSASPVLALRFVTPSSTTVRVAERLTLRVTARDETTGNALPLPRVRFTSSDRGVARVDNTSGEVTAVAPGRATITAEAGEARATLPLTILAAAPVVAQNEPTTAPVPQPTQQQTQQQTPPPVNPAPVSVAPPVQNAPATATATPAELEAQARTAITAYARAYESRELDRVRAVWPGLTDGYASELNTFFDLARDVRVTISGVDAASGYDGTSGTITRVIARVNIRFNDGRRGRSQDDRWAVSLRRDGATWRIVSVGSP
jgi:eukaryotic-like serine/threonine-protein kinase